MKYLLLALTIGSAFAGLHEQRQWQGEHIRQHEERERKERERERRLQELEHQRYQEQERQQRQDSNRRYGY